MGMLGVRMRADYGEGRARAISRLFESILRTTGDVSIFNWAGQYCGSRDPGRSMYPTDFDAYLHISETAAKPARTLSAVTLDHVGIHARFDLCEIREIVVEEDNATALQAVQHLEQSNAAGMDHSCTCEFSLFNGDKHTIIALCPLSSLRAFLEGMVGNGDYRWVLARFAGVEASDWFLCEIRGTVEAPSDGLFSEVIRDQLVGPPSNHAGGVVNVVSFMQYLESSGPPARRIATEELDQELLKPPNEYIRHAYMWIG
jgi:hypothetical protein